jgi:hypothetical protein
MESDAVVGRGLMRRSGHLGPGTGKSQPPPPQRCRVATVWNFQYARRRAEYGDESQLPDGTGLVFSVTW